MSEAAKKQEPVELPELEAIARAAAQDLHDRRAEEVVVLRVRELLPIASYFVVASAGSVRGTQNLADAVERVLKESSLERRGVHGRKEGRWVCVDYDEVVVHLFERDARRFYELENLWAGAPRVEMTFGPRPEEADATEGDPTKPPQNSPSPP